MKPFLRLLILFLGIGLIFDAPAQGDIASPPALPWTDSHLLYAHATPALLGNHAVKIAQIPGAWAIQTESGVNLFFWQNDRWQAGAPFAVQDVADIAWMAEKRQVMLREYIDAFIAAGLGAPRL